MPKKPTTPVGEVVKEYLGKFPDTSTRTLASMLLKDNPGIFKDYEQVRGMVRYYRGKSGKHNRELVSNREHFKVTDTHNPFDLPEPLDNYEVFPYELPSRYKNTLILSDLHIPFHDLAAVTTALDYGVKHKVDSILLLGDIFDFFAVSRFIKDPRKRNLGLEVETGKQFLADLKKIFPDAKIFFKQGNHEARYEAYLWVKAPELIGMEIFEFDNIFEFDKHQIQYIHNRAEIHIGDNFTALHGHEFMHSAYSPVNPARGLYLRFEENSICGHFHRPSHHTQKTGKDKIKATWSLGCLCQLRPEYASQNKWLHGFAHLTRESDKDFHLKNFMIINGKLYES